MGYMRAIHNYNDLLYFGTAGSGAFRGQGKVAEAVKVIEDNLASFK